MKQEVKPEETTRAQAFELWMTSPMPMVHLTKTFDVTRIRKTAERKGWKFNMLMCWCICKAATQIDQYHHVQMDGGQGSGFLARLQKEMNGCIV